MSHAFVTAAEKAVLREAKEIRRRKRIAFLKAKPPRVEKVGQQSRQQDKAHLARIRQLPCLATLIREGLERYGVDAAHVRHGYPVPGWGGSPGMGRKPHDWRTLPLCRTEHRWQHSMNEAVYWRALRIDPPAVCMALRECPDVAAMVAVIRRFAQETRNG